MDATLRRPAWRLLLVPIVAAALLFGWLAYARGDARPPQPQPRLTIGDVMIAVAKAKAGIFLQYDDVTDAPPGPVHTGHAPVKSVAWGFDRPITRDAGGGANTGKRSFHDIKLTRTTDKHSAGLLKESVSGDGKNAVIYFTNVSLKGIPVDYMDLALEDTFVTSYDMSAADDIPTETLTLNARRATFTVRLGGISQTIVLDPVDPVP